MSDTEFWYFLCTHYNYPPLNLQIHCNGCDTAFGVTHALRCSIGGLVIACHSEICEKILYLSSPAFTPPLIHAKPLIHQGRTRSEQDIRQGSDKYKETRGDVMILFLGDQKVETIIDVKLGDADTDYYKNEPMAELLAWW